MYAAEQNLIAPFQSLCLVATIFISCSSPFVPSHDVVFHGRISTVRGHCPNLVLTVQATRVQVATGILNAGDTLQVVTKGSTEIRGRGSACDGLADDHRVEVRGRLASHRVTATHLSIIVS